MKRLTLTAGMMLAVVVPGVAGASSLLHSEAVSYGRAYAHVVHVFGQRAAGCKLIGPRSTCTGSTTASRIRSSTAVLQRMFAPRPVYHAAAVSASATVTSTHTTGYSGGGGASGVPACASESGTNYSTGSDNTNPSGATGRYQIIPSTHAALCSDLGWSPGEQDQCAARIYAAQGSGAWVGCGG